MRIKIRQLVILALIGIFSQGFAKDNQQFYLLTMYHIANEEQEQMIDKYLEQSYIPAMHRLGMEEIGVFKTIEGRNENQNSVMVLIPLKSMKQFEKLQGQLEDDKQYLSSSAFFRKAPHNQPPFERIENVIMHAFASAPVIQIPKFDTPGKERVYELRSYESATQYLHKQKVKMFNSGESELFVKLGFQPVFFASVIAGADMPNLMYLTCHANKAAQDENWNRFRESEEWGKMKTIEEYKNTVSNSVKMYLYPAKYSDY